MYEAHQTSRKLHEVTPLPATRSQSFGVHPVQVAPRCLRMLAEVELDRRTIHLLIWLSSLLGAVIILEWSQQKTPADPVA